MNRFSQEVHSKLKGWAGRLCLAVVVTGQLLGAQATWAHEGYMTTYNHHIMPGEFEIMVMNDFTTPSDPKREDDGHGDYFSHMLEVEYGLSDQLAFEFMVEAFEDTETGQSEFTGFRYEARYRIFKDEVPLNPTLYAEYEDLHLKTRYKMETSGWVEPPYAEEEGEEPSREHILESRLILSEDFGPYNVAFNWINESDLNSGETAFGYSLGFLVPVAPDAAAAHSGKHMTGGEHSNSVLAFIRPSSLAFEFFGALGDTLAFGLTPARQEHYFQPSITFDVGQSQMLTLGFGIGLTKASDQLIRLSWGIML
ncbi:MAG: hypothetical protein HYV36_00280 [Lentisphaerae bacterium]|nr:hypothetical protein [Lentisphaerota bacterium]